MVRIYVIEGWELHSWIWSSDPLRVRDLLMFIFHPPNCFSSHFGVIGSPFML